jgi:hypothetical protein
MNNPTDAWFDWSALLTQERAAIRMPSAALPDPARAMSGLAFSGGGIRSASFNLGVIQALSEQKLLREFDYLSCVSGGGYIGGWLSAFIHRKCNGRVEDAEALLKTGGDEHPSIRYLRSYSNYLTPRARVFSADTLTAVATYLRNLYLNLTLLLLALTSVLLAPRLLVWTVRELSGWHNGAPVQTWPLWLGGIACAAVAMGFAGVNLGGRGGYTSEPPWYTRQGAVLGVIVAPGLVSAWLISYGIYVDAPALLERSIGAWMLGSTVVYIGAWGIGWAIGRWLEARHTTGRVALANAAFSRPRLACMGAFAVLAGLIGGALLAGFVQIVALIPRGSEDPLGYFGAWLASALATALLLKFYSLTIISHIGLMGRFFSHDSLEWWSRLGGWVLLFAALWAALFCIVFVAPAFFAWAPQWLLGSGALTWIGATAFGVLFGRRPDTGLALRADWRDLIAKAMPYVFIVGLLGLLSFALHQLLLALACNATLQTLFDAPCAASTPLSATAWQPYVEVESGQFKTIPIGLVAALCLGSFALATALAWRIDVNLFSIYHFYRQRLVRCYLGASRSKARVPHPFTGFDPRDDLRLAELAHPENGSVICQRPYPIFNTALNLVSGKELAWQERLAAAFSFTPLACGYSFTLPDEKGECLSHYRPTARYMEGAWLGSAMAISGAAASPNMGYHSSPALCFLLTVFNVRLGHWSPNPASDRVWQQHGPAFGGTYLLKELFGLTDYTSDFSYLSDGGHFENLGIYELVRRRVATIVAIDAGQDQKRNYDDLGNAIRKCYADFGVVIEIHADALKSGYHAVGRIVYPDAPEGTLIYLKPSLTGGEPADLLNYSLTHPGFPHQPTSDQNFDESQFESYRKLGHWIGRATFDAPNAAARQGATGNAPLTAIAAWLSTRASQTAPAHIAPTVMEPS